MLSDSTAELLGIYLFIPVNWEESHNYLTYYMDVAIQVKTIVSQRAIFILWRDETFGAHTPRARPRAVVEFGLLGFVIKYNSKLKITPKRNEVFTISCQADNNILWLGAKFLFKYQNKSHAVEP